MGHSLLNEHDGHRASRSNLFEVIIMLFNLNDTTIKRLLELKTSLVKSWYLICVLTKGITKMALNTYFLPMFAHVPLCIEKFTINDKIK